MLAGPRPEKRNLVLQLRGRGERKPILFLAHLDVVEARPEDRPVPPFALTEKDGWLYGRGAADIKDEAADLVSDLIRLRTEGFAPARDVVVALTDDEEAGGDANGAAWLLRERRDLVDVAYVINTDAGGAQMVHGRRLRNPVQTSEKVYASYQLEVRRPGGHSSLPTPDNAIYRLAAALGRIARHRFPVRLNHTTRSFFLQLARQDSGQARTDLRAITRTPPDAGAARRLSATPMYNSTMRTTCVATMLEPAMRRTRCPSEPEPPSSAASFRESPPTRCGPRWYGWWPTLRSR